MAKKITVKTTEAMTDEDIQSMVADVKFAPVNEFASKVKYFGLNDGYVIDWDLQSREKTNGDDLVSSFITNGLVTMPEAWVDATGVTHMLKGHRRNDGFVKLFDNHPDDFARIFPKGIPFKVYTNLTENDALRIRHDHSLDLLKESLSTVVECIRMTRPMYHKGFNEGQVRELTWEAVMPIMGNLKKYRELKIALTNAKSDREKTELLYNSQKGNFQKLKRHSEAPNVLLDYFVNAEHGEVPAFKKWDIYNALVMLHNKECAEDRKSDDPQMYDRTNPGPAFLQAFEDAKREKIKVVGADDDAIPKDKPMTAKEREDLAGLCKSKCALMTLKLINGNATAKPAFIRYDEWASRSETANQIDPDTMELVATAITKAGKALTEKDRKAINTILEVKSKK